MGAAHRLSSVFVEILASSTKIGLRPARFRPGSTNFGLISDQVDCGFGPTRGGFDQVRGDFDNIWTGSSSTTFVAGFDHDWVGFGSAWVGFGQALLTRPTLASRFSDLLGGRP